MKKSTLSEIEDCKEHICFNAAIRIAEYFCISIDYLIGRNDNPQYEYYLHKAEDALLLDIPEGFISIFKYAKNKGLKQETISLQEHFHLIKWFEDWKKRNNHTIV